MARRALHLRWQYVGNHLALFGALLLIFAGAMAAATAFLDDPARGLAVGAIPMLFALILWATTNAAGYPQRGSDLPIEERSPIEGTVPDSAPTGDPFAEPRPRLSPDELADKAAAAANQETTGRRRWRKKSDVA